MDKSMSARGDSTMIDHNVATPLYLQLEQVLERAIYEGEYKVGDKLPSESELCHKYQVSRITVRQALNLLTGKGLIFSAHGKGSFVKRPDLGQELDKIVSFRRVLEQKGLKGMTRIHVCQEETANENIEAYLGDKVFRLDLVGHASQMPVVYYRSFFVPELGNEMLQLAREAEKRGTAFSTYDFYADLSVQVADIEQTVRAGSADRELAEVLELPQGHPLMILESIYRGEGGDVLEYKQGYYHSQLYSFRLHRKM